jgi:hypothetical protein
MRQFLGTPVHCESFIVGHPSRQKDKQLISVLDSVLTTLQVVGVGKSESLDTNHVSFTSTRAKEATSR